jgi:hypothetical protein
MQEAATAGRTVTVASPHWGWYEEETRNVLGELDVCPMVLGPTAAEESASEKVGWVVRRFRSVPELVAALRLRPRLIEVTS